MTNTERFQTSTLDLPADTDDVFGTDTFDYERPTAADMEWAANYFYGGWSHEDDEWRWQNLGR